MIQRRMLIITVLGGLLGGGAALWARSEGRAQRPPDHAVRPEAPPAPRLVWTRGQHAVYRFRIETRGMMNVQALLPNAGPGREDSFEMSLAGELCIDAVDSARLALRLRGVEVSTMLGAAPLASAPTAGALEALRAAMTLGEDGELRALRFSEESAPEARAAVRQLLSLIRVTSPPSDRRDYVVTEEGLTAPWRARYVMEASGRFEKHEHLDARLAGGKYETGAGRYEGRVRSSEGILERLTGSREKSTQIGSVVAARESTTIDLALAALGALTGAELAEVEDDVLHLERTRAASTLRLDPEFAALARAASQRLVKDETIPGVIARMSSGGKITARDVSILKHLLRLEPRSTEEVLPELVARDWADDVFQSVAAVLNVAGTPESQAVLRTAAQARRGDEATYASLMTYLGTAANPTAETEALLAEAAQSDPRAAVRRAAELALGALAHEVRGDAPERAARILEAALDGLARATGEADLHHALLVVGNIGLLSQVAPLEARLDDPRPEVRALSAWALRFVPSEVAIEALLSVAQRDPEDTVRARAVAALGFTPSSREKLVTLARMLAEERSVLVTGEVLRQLARQAELSSEASALLRGYAERCGNAELCHLANQLIARLPS